MMDRNDRRKQVDKILAVKEIGQRLGVSRGTVIYWIRTGRLKAFKLGGGRLWRIRERDLRKFIRDGSDAGARSKADTASAIE